MLTESGTFGWFGERSVSAFLSRIWRRDQRFRLLLTYYQHEYTYSLALASLSAYIKQHFPEVIVSLLPILDGDDLNATTQKAQRFAPNLIAISAMHPTWLPTIPYLEAMRQRMPRVPVIVGGYQAMFSSEETLNHPAVDLICVGDGEEPLAELIRQLRAADGHRRFGSHPLNGLWYKAENGQFVKSAAVLTQDFSELPFPDYSIFERNGQLEWLSPHAVESMKLNTLPVLSGRGCPYRCSYCSNTSLLELFKGKGEFLRKYDPERLVDELVRLKNRYHIEYFQFWDELFTFDRKYAYRLMELYGAEVRLPFSIFARVEQMSEEFCQRAANAGCHSMWFGVESGSEDYRRRYLNRRMSNQQVIDAAETARRHGIKRMIFNMVGLPFEKRDNILETLELARKIQPELAIFGQFLPLPGTPLYDLAKDANLLLEPSAEQQMWTLGQMNIQEQPGCLKKEELTTLVDEIWKYLRENNACDP